MPKRSTGMAFVVLRTIGELLITLGIVFLLFVVYSLYITDIAAARKQREVNTELDDSWRTPPQARQTPARGKAFTRLYIPSIDPEYRFAVIEGVGSDELATGPGHYPGTALPGEPGNFAVAGHRIGKGAPFNDLDQLKACDPIIVETASDWFVYRVMPMPGQVSGWEQARTAKPRCGKVSALRYKIDGRVPYAEVVGRRIVTPDRGDAVAPIPYSPGDKLPIAKQASLLTLTTCHPEYGNSERMIIHAVLAEGQIAKTGKFGYQTLLRQIGER